MSSIFKSSYSKSKFEVIVVDNNSHDGSCAFIKKNFPKVTIIRLKENVGFAMGNNEGYKHARGEYIALLNNDTEVDKNWLTELVAVAQDSRVGIVASKILLQVPFVEVSITSSVVQQSDLDQSTNFSPRGVLIEDISCPNSDCRDLIWYSTGFDKQKVLSGVGLRWTTGKATVLLPILEEKNTFSFVFHGYPSNDSQLPMNAKVSVKNKELCHFSLSPNSVFNKKITINKSTCADNLVWLVQNAGNLLLKDGYSKDIGSVTRILGGSVEEFYEPDSQFFSQERKLVSACGAGMLIKREVIEKIGFFNQHYFMYYEDIDFCLRVWKHGWDIVFAPKAIMHHTHRATTGKTESSFFISMIEKNHLFLLLTHFSLSTFLQEYFLFGCRLFDAILKQFVFRFKHWDKYQIWKIKASGRLDAFISFHKKIFTFIKIRYWWKSREVRNYNQLKHHLY